MARLNWFHPNHPRHVPHRCNYLEKRIRYPRFALTEPFTGAGVLYRESLSRPSQLLLLIFPRNSPEAGRGMFMPGNLAASPTRGMNLRSKPRMSLLVLQLQQSASCVLAAAPLASTT